MNKLEEYRDKKGKEFGNTVWDSPNSLPAKMATEDFAKGFDAAIALDLPVKFHLWAEEREVDGTAYPTGEDEWYVNFSDFKAEFANTHQIYQYWIDNIYKPE